MKGEPIDVECTLCCTTFSMGENDYGLTSGHVMCPNCDAYFQDFCDTVNDCRDEKIKRSTVVHKLTKIILPEDTK